MRILSEAAFIVFDRKKNIVLTLTKINHFLILHLRDRFEIRLIFSSKNLRSRELSSLRSSAGVITVNTGMMQGWDKRSNIYFLPYLSRHSFQKFP